MSVRPLAVIVSLPNQLFGHIPITQISSEFTHALETMNSDEEADEEDEEEDEGEDKHPAVPDLSDIFQPGRYVRCRVSAVHAPGSTEGLYGSARVRDEVEKASRRVELTLLPEQVNEGVAKADLKSGFVRLCSCVLDVCSHYHRHSPHQSKVSKTTATYLILESLTYPDSCPSRTHKSNLVRQNCILGKYSMLLSRRSRAMAGRVTSPPHPP